MSSKSNTAQTQSRHQFLLFVGCITLILTVLFFTSFRPDYVHFSNDGPFGHHVSKCAQLPEGFSGVWNDLNWLGINDGVFFLDITALIKWILGPLGFAKFAAPLSIFLLGPCAWFLFRRLGLTSAACVLGG